MQILSQKKDSEGKLQIVLEISSGEAGSFLEKEENLAKLLNEVGCLATAEILKNADIFEKQIEVENKKYYQKALQKKSMKPPMGASR
jgi:hypothetical protein